VDVSKSKVYGALVAAQLFFATLPIALKVLLREMSSPSIALYRVMGAALLFVLLQRILLGERVRGWRDHASLAAFAVFGVVLNQILYITAVEFTTAAAAQTMMAVGPALTLLVALIARQETATLGKGIGIALAASGALALVGVGMHTGGAFGNLLALLNVTCYSIYLVISRGMVRRYHPLTVITWVFVYGVIGILPWGFASAAEEATGASPLAWLLIAYIVVVPTVGAYYLNLFALRYVDSSVVAVFIYLQPVVTAFLAHSILGERVSARLLPAALLIFAGVFVAARAQRASRSQAPDDLPTGAANG
jgi:drug/metabolite transporter (DMT)-like permease